MALRMAANIGIIGMDFDLTLVDYPEGKPHVPARTLDLLADLVRGGTEVGIVSGRYWWEMRDTLTEAGLAWGNPFPSFVAARETFIYWFREGRMTPDDEWNLPRGEEAAELARVLVPRETEFVTALEAEGLKMRRFILWGDYGMEMHFASAEEAERAREHLARWVASIRLARTHRNRFLAHVVLATAGKGRSLLRAAQSRGLRPDQVLAIGDTLNDLDMLDGALGFWTGAVGNADDVIKDAVTAAGGVVAEAAAGDGVAEIIATYRERGLVK